MLCSLKGKNKRRYSEAERSYLKNECPCETLLLLLPPTKRRMSNEPLMRELRCPRNDRFYFKNVRNCRKNELPEEWFSAQQRLPMNAWLNCASGSANDWSDGCPKTKLITYARRRDGVAGPEHRTSVWTGRPTVVSPEDRVSWPLLWMSVWTGRPTVEWPSDWL